MTTQAPKHYFYNIENKLLSFFFEWKILSAKITLIVYMYKVIFRCIYKLLY